jgi:carbonic anhydrase
MNQQEISVVRSRAGRALRVAALSLLAVAAVAAPLPATDATCPPEWNYGADKGPDKWGGLKPEWALCGTGRSQSPIDIPQDDISRDNNMYLPQPDYPRMKIKVQNTGTAIKVTPVPPAQPRLHLGSNTYVTLDEFHFHVPSEHRVHGVKEAGELHLVHRFPDGRVLVLAVLLRAGGSTNNPMLQEIINLMPTQCGQSQTSTAATFDLTQLMAPNMAHYFFYQGSLTTPPCTEGVQFILEAEALVVPAAQIAALKAVIGENARPVQPVRVIRWRQMP